jgi:hypothetical protein
MRASRKAEELWGVFYIFPLNRELVEEQRLFYRKQSLTTRIDHLTRGVFHAADHNNVDDMISRDIARTFPEHPMFCDPEGQGRLFRVLQAYARLDPEVRRG